MQEEPLLHASPLPPLLLLVMLLALVLR